MNFLRLGLAIILSEAAGSIGTIFTGPAIGTWYTTIAKPPFNPPSWIFGPVWTTLFFLMGIAVYIVWQRTEHNALTRRALIPFFIQFVLNIAWSALFFGLHSPLLGLIDIVLLWAAILWTIVAFWKASRTAAYLLVPYLLWVSFAGVLNYFIWRLN